jgi:hypothetical protein
VARRATLPKALIFRAQRARKIKAFEFTYIYENLKRSKFFQFLFTATKI